MVVLDTMVALSFPAPLLFVLREDIDLTSNECDAADGPLRMDGLVWMDPAEALWTSVRGNGPRRKIELFREPREYVDSASFPLPAKLFRGTDSLRVVLLIIDVIAV